MPVREKGRRRPGSQPARPFSRPQPPADRRQSAALLAYSPGFTAETDWLLEESGFELLVPLVDAGLFGRNGTEIRRVRGRCSRPDPAMTQIGFEWHEAVGGRRC